MMTTKLFTTRTFQKAASTVLALTLLSLPALPQGKGKGGDDDPDRVITNGGMPAGWSVRTDRGTPDQEKVSEAGGTFHFVMGPAGTFFNNAWTKSGDYKYSARVTQVKAPSHPTSYGIMFGGSNIAGAMQTYTYFLVRNQGQFFIANRDGDARPTTVVNWTDHAAIQKQAADGKQVNTLGVQVQGANVIFTVNGTEVTRLQKSQLHVDGQIGFRIGHNMDVDVDQVTR
jgi:hypothetical protein